MGLLFNKPTPFGTTATYFMISEVQVKKLNVIQTPALQDVRIRIDGWADKATRDQTIDGKTPQPTFTMYINWNEPCPFDLSVDVVPQAYTLMMQLPDWIGATQD